MYKKPRPPRRTIKDLFDENQALREQVNAPQRSKAVSDFTKLDKATVRAQIEAVSDTKTRQLLRQLFKVVMALCLEDYDKEDIIE